MSTAASVAATRARFRRARDLLAEGVDRERAIEILDREHPSQLRGTNAKAVDRAAAWLAARGGAWSRRASRGQAEPIDDDERKRRDALRHELRKHHSVARHDPDEDRDDEIARLMAEQHADEDGREVRPLSGDACRGDGLLVRIEVAVVDHAGNIFEGVATSWTVERIVIDHEDGTTSTVLLDVIEAMRLGGISVSCDPNASPEDMAPMPSPQRATSGPAPFTRRVRP